MNCVSRLNREDLRNESLILLSNRRFYGCCSAWKRSLEVRFQIQHHIFEFVDWNGRLGRSRGTTAARVEVNGDASWLDLALNFYDSPDCCKAAIWSCEYQRALH